MHKLQNINSVTRKRDCVRGYNRKYENSQLRIVRTTIIYKFEILSYSVYSVSMPEPMELTR